jgi:hypothetical protein
MVQGPISRGNLRGKFINNRQILKVSMLQIRLREVVMVTG